MGTGFESQRKHFKVRVLDRLLTLPCEKAEMLMFVTMSEMLMLESRKISIIF